MEFPAVWVHQIGAMSPEGGPSGAEWLAGLPRAVAIGVAYAAQEMQGVPAGPTDVRLGRVATENGVVVCGGAS